MLGTVFSNGSHYIEIEGNYIFHSPEINERCPFIVYWKNGITVHYSPHRLDEKHVIKEMKVKNVEDYWMAEVAVRNCVKSGINQ